MPLTKTEIIDELYRSKKVLALLSRLPDKVKDDLKQEVMILLLLKPEIEIQDIYKRGKLYSYFAKFMYNQLFYSQSSFHRLYKTYSEIPVESVRDFSELPEIDLTDELEKAMAGLSPYHNKLLRNYAEIGNYRETGEQMNIAWKSIYNAVTKAKEIVKNEINKKL